MRFRLLLLIGIALLAMFILGCATIMCSPRQDVQINSSPDQAELLIQDKDGLIVFEGKTPNRVSLKRNSTYTVTVSTPGYQDSQVMITRSFNPVFLGNIIFGGLIGMIIDASSGAIYTLAPNTLMVSLVTASIPGQTAEKYAVLQYKDNKGEVHTAATPLTKK